jgi:hypothetical protein
VFHSQPGPFQRQLAARSSVLFDVCFNNLQCFPCAYVCEAKGTVMTSAETRCETAIITTIIIIQYTTAFVPT